MTLYAGLDVSQRETEICVIDRDGRRIWRGRCSSDPESIAAALRMHAAGAARVGMETWPLSIWLWHGLRELGVTVIHARHVSAALSLQVNKTDANDAHGIAQVVRSGWYRAVSVKSLQSCRIRALLTARTELVSIRTTLYNQIRGLLKTFGVVLAPGRGGTFEQAVLLQCPSDALVRSAIEALLTAWRAAGVQKQKLELHLMRLARGSDTCRRMATIPGVGAITALTFVATIDNPNVLAAHRCRRFPWSDAATISIWRSRSCRPHLKIWRSHGPKPLVRSCERTFDARTARQCASEMGPQARGTHWVKKGQGRRRS
jgi:transposase